MSWRNIFIVTAVTFTGLCAAILLLMTPAQVKSNPALTATPPPTPTMCPQATAEYLRVDPVTSPTGQFSQTVHVYINYGEAVTITTESGTFTHIGSNNGWSYPANVDVALLTDTVHHLTVYAKVREIEQNGCMYGGYTLSTSSDSNGNPLIIEQKAWDSYNFLPYIVQ